MRHGMRFSCVTTMFALFLLFVQPPAAQPPQGDRSGEAERLLNPRALAVKALPETDQQTRMAFGNPPAEYRSMPLWVWNDELDWPRLKEQLGQFQRQGMGGVFVHPRPGLMTEYLGEEWFRMWKLSAQEGKRLGISVNIYDENSYPAGFAGGHVPARAPDTAAQYVQADLDADPARVSSTRGVNAGLFAVTKDPSGQVASARRIRAPSELKPSESLLVFRLRRASGNPWTGGFPYVDLTNPQTAPHFIATTYEPYKKHLGAEFGKSILWSFNDEPLIATAGAYDAAALALPLSYNTLSEFQKRCGYDLAENLPSLFWDVGDFRKTRFDYWQTLHDLWKENFFRPMFEWCDRNNLQFTGHWMEHEWPFPWITPADASLYAYEHVPGIDMLEGANLRTTGADPHMLFTIKQVASVAHQLGRRAFCEAYGVAGWDSTFEHYKRFGDWLMVHGINFMNQHLAFETVRGARKRDHPQSFSDVSSWWPYYKLHGDHLGRVSYMLTRGVARNRLVVLEPTTSGFLWARRGGDTPELARMRSDNAELNQFLADHQADFDLADEYILEWFGKVNGRKLGIGRAAYDLVVWQANTANVRHQTVPLLEQYLAAGGEVLALGPPADYVDGRPSDRVTSLARRYSAQWRQVSGLPELLAAIRTRLQPRVKFEPELPSGVGFAERHLDSGDRVLFFANAGLAPVTAKAAVEGAALEEWDTASGKIAGVRSEPDRAGHIRFDLNLPPAGSRLFVVRKLGASQPPPSPARFARIQSSPWKVTADASNVLVLDYCDLTVGGVERGDINTWEANWTIWRQHGFERPAWDNAVQFKTRIFDRNNFDPGSGFEARFRFEVSDAAAIGGLELAMEAPELYQVKVNGNPVSFAAAKRWLDPHIKVASIAGSVRPGENIVIISARPFDVRMELENIYLRGNFSVQAGEKGFRLAAPPRLDFGSWARQGYPFYGDSVLYETEVEAPPNTNQLRVELGEWQGSVAEILLDSQRVAVLGWPPYAAEFPVTPGKHTVAIRSVSTPRNVFGPFHNPVKPRMRAWPAAWAQFAEHQPPGAEYDILDYGLMKPVEISAGTMEGSR